MCRGRIIEELELASQASNLKELKIAETKRIKTAELKIANGQIFIEIVIKQ